MTEREMLDNLTVRLAALEDQTQHLGARVDLLEIGGPLLVGPAGEMPPIEVRSLTREEKDIIIDEAKRAGLVYGSE